MRPSLSLVLAVTMFLSGGGSPAGANDHPDVSHPVAVTNRADADEIEHLLQFAEHSGCVFLRNGDWFDANRASAHLRSKYKYLAAQGQIVSAEDFIAKAASFSSLSAKPYEVKCASERGRPTAEWLTAELTRYRQISKAR